MSRTIICLLSLALAACTFQVAPSGQGSPLPPGAPDAGQPGAGDPPPDGSDTPPSSEVAVSDIPELPGSRLWVRPNAIPAPGIVLLHGSEGGSERFIDDVARPLAESGFAVVTFCWFGCTGKPDKIYRIPLEDTVAAIDWLAASDAVGGRKVGLFGWSRGAEQSVLLASLLGSVQRLAAVAVHAASDTVVASFDPATQDSVYETDPNTGQQIFGPAWTWQGQPLYGETTSFDQAGPRIAVENYPGPLYLSHGTADELWPVQRSKNIEAARQQAGLITEAHYWDGEGHILMQPATLQAFRDTLADFFHRNLDQ